MFPIVCFVTSSDCTWLRGIESLHAARMTTTITNRDKLGNTQTRGRDRAKKAETDWTGQNKEKLVPKRGATSAVWKWFGYEKSEDMSLPVGLVNLRLLASCLCSCLSFNRCKSGRHYITILTNACFYIKGKREYSQINLWPKGLCIYC